MSRKFAVTESVITYIKFCLWAQLKDLFFHINKLMLSQPRFLEFPSVFKLTFPPWVDAFTAMSGSSASRRHFEFVNATWKSQADFFKFQSARRACADRDCVPLNLGTTTAISWFSVALYACSIQFSSQREEINSKEMIIIFLNAT